MISFNKKKYICCVILGLLIAVLLLVNRVSPLFAATKQGAISGPHLMNATIAGNNSPHIQQYTRLPVPGPWPGNHQTNNQLIQGSFENRTSVYLGRNQGNDGNQGFNAGNSQDNSSNKGNLVTNQRRNIALQVNRQQVIQGNGGSGTNNTFTLGTNQGNTGNQGLNQGNNQDNSGNSGNQVNNQGNVIGTQINAPGTNVNNNGSTIQHQVNHLSLTLPVHLQLRLLPNPQIALGIGG